MDAMSKIFLCWLICLAAPVATAQESDDLMGDTLRAVVGLRSVVPETARTAGSLGTERRGNGVVIDEDGLVLTIGYLVMEASDVEVTNGDGEYVPAETVAYDFETGFGLVRATQSLGIKALTLGDSSNIQTGDAALVVAQIGPDYLQPAEVVDVREFPGYWEYLLDAAIFTTPPFQGFGGAALIDTDGALVGIGSLILRNAREGEDPAPGNMFVPVNLLKPILDSLIANGRSGRESRPWLGLYTEMDRGHLFVQRVAPGGPADSAEVRPHDIILGVENEDVNGMADFLRKVWATGPAGVPVRISILREGKVLEITVDSADRYDWLKLNPGSRYSTML